MFHDLWPATKLPCPSERVALEEGPLPNIRNESKTACWCRGLRRMFGLSADENRDANKIRAQNLARRIEEYHRRIVLLRFALVRLEGQPEREAELEAVLLELARLRLELRRTRRKLQRRQYDRGRSRRS